MPIRRPVLYLLAALVAALSLAACGGGGDAKTASSGSDVDKLLADTFAGGKKVTSGRLALDLRIDSKGGATEGPVAVKIAGPFQSQGAGKLPRFDLDLGFTGRGQSVKAGVTSTGDRGFVLFNGTDYAVSDEVFKQFRTGYEQAQKQSAQDSKRQTSFANLGIDPRKWLIDPKNAGEAKVGDADTIRITGGVDVPKLLDDVNLALGKAASLGLQGSGKVPEKLTDAQRKRIVDNVKDLKVEIYTGKEDTTLRRMLVTALVTNPRTASAQAKTSNVRFDFSLSELNKPQDVAAPAKTKPFEELLQQFGGLGALGGLGGGSGSGSSGSGSGTGGAGAGSSAADQKKLKAYTDCITAAGSDTAKAQKCAQLLTP